ncbi:MAG TPA: ATP-grasp domain-containing protein [Rhodocyclaceae bacterium]|nr:ATP-grasp domain-containing protein [Rhodocyclaceae bacterium]
MARTPVLVLFAQEWDRLALEDPRLARRFEFHYAGFDLFRFPENARLLTLNVRRYIDRLVAKCRRLGVSAVVSAHEQFGALIAAVVAQRLGLPGPDPRGILTAQHKYLARQAIGRVLPDAVPPYAAFPFTVQHAEEIGLPFPFFVKPVKATFSVLARRVDSFAELRRHLRFRPFEQHIIKRLVRPFNDLLHDHLDCEVNAHYLIAEGLIEGMQLNVDGYAERGRIRILGIVDEIMYPGTMAFNRFEYPTSLPGPVRERIARVAEQSLAAVGFDHGLFNIELCYDPARDRITVVEINPRLASQFLTLYEWVDGIRLYEIALDLALGVPPRCEPAPQAHGHAASFIFRRFDGKPVHPEPSRAQLRHVAERHPEARLMLYFKHGSDLAREMKWLGSHRYAVLNLPGRDLADLYASYRDIRDLLGFHAHSGPEPAPLWPWQPGLALQRGGGGAP